MFSAELGMVVSRPCWFLVFWLKTAGFISLGFFPVHVIISLRGFGISWGTRRGIIVGALGGFFILVRGWYRYRRYWQVGG